MVRYGVNHGEPAWGTRCSRFFAIEIRRIFPQHNGFFLDLCGAIGQTRLTESSLGNRNSATTLSPLQICGIPCPCLAASTITIGVQFFHSFTIDCSKECRESELGPEAIRNDHAHRSAVQHVSFFCSPRLSTIIHYRTAYLIPQITLQNRLERQRGSRGLPHCPEMPRAARNEEPPPARSDVEIGRRQRPGQDGRPADGAHGQETENGHDDGHETGTTDHDASVYALHVG